MATAKDILNLIKEKDVKYVDVRFTDIRGKMQHVTFDIDLVDDDFLEDGTMEQADGSRALRLIEFDVAKKDWTGRSWLYPLSAWASWLVPLVVFESLRFLESLDPPLERVATRT